MLATNIIHIAQPLDVSPFHSLKSHWHNACEQYMSSYPGRTVTIYNFSKIFSQAWYQAMVPKTIMAGFRATGVYPFNRRAIRIPGVKESIATPTAKLAYQQGIKYLPFHSPYHGKHCQELQLSEEFHFYEKVTPELRKTTISDSNDTSPTLENCQHSVAVVSPPTHDCQHSSNAISQPPDNCQEVHDKVNAVLLQRKVSNEPLWSEFLKVPNPAYTIKHSSPGKARVLTSASFLENLAEKEKKKKEAIEEKERRKKEREEKRMLKQKLKEQQRKTKKKLQKNTLSSKTKKKLQKNTLSSKRKQKTASLQKKQASPFTDDEDHDYQCMQLIYM